MTLSQGFTSVTRWLLVVIGCAVLATAQPMSAASPDASPAGKSADDTIIYPKGAGQTTGSVQPADRDTGHSLVLVAALLLAVGGAWLLLQRRRSAPSGGRSRRLQIDETRPLGGRQYLVVADYDGQKFLLGVTPGRIQMLTPLGEADATGEDTP